MAIGDLTEEDLKFIENKIGSANIEETLGFCSIALETINNISFSLELNSDEKIDRIQAMVKKLHEMRPDIFDFGKQLKEDSQSDKHKG